MATLVGHHCRSRDGWFTQVGGDNFFGGGCYFGFLWTKSMAGKQNWVDFKTLPETRKLFEVSMLIFRGQFRHPFEDFTRKILVVSKTKKNKTEIMTELLTNTNDSCCKALISSLSLSISFSFSPTLSPSLSISFFSLSLYLSSLPSYLLFFLSSSLSLAFSFSIYIYIWNRLL